MLKGMERPVKHVHYAPINDRIEPQPISIDITTPFKFKKHSVINHGLDKLTMVTQTEFPLKSLQVQNAPIKSNGFK